MANAQGADNPTTDRAWLEDGIVFQEYNTTITLASIHTLSLQTLALVEQYGRQTVPTVCILHDNKIKLNLADMAKVAMIPVAQHMSWIIVVGLADQYRDIVETANKLFFNHRIVYFDQVLDAKRFALAHLEDQENMFDHIPQ